MELDVADESDRKVAPRGNASRVKVAGARTVGTGVHPGTDTYSQGLRMAAMVKELFGCVLAPASI